MKRLFYITRNVGRIAVKVGPWCLIVWKRYERGKITIGGWNQAVHLHRVLWR